VVLRATLAALALVACDGASAPGTGNEPPINNGAGLPSCFEVDPCYADGGQCFTCQERAGFICVCSDAGPDASPYRSSCLGTEDPCTASN